MTPTREQVIEWAKEAGFQNAYLPPQFFDPLERLCTLAMSAGRDQGLREAKEVCEAERVEDTGTEGDVAYNMAIGHCAAAIEQLRASACNVVLGLAATTPRAQREHTKPGDSRAL